MIQSAQVASKFTLFTHHAKTFPNLVTALRNSMLRTGVFKSEKTAEEQVVQVLNFDIHLVKDFRGRRFIERITECIPVEEKNEYTFDHRNEKTLEGKFDKFFDNATIYFTKTTNRELYKYRNVLEFVDDKYVLSNPISENNIKEMRINMNDDDQVAFDAFLERNWGIKPPKMIKYDEDGNEIKPVLPEKKSQEQLTKEFNESFVKSLNNEASKFVGGIGHRNEERRKAEAMEAKRAAQEAKAIERQEKNIEKENNNNDNIQRRRIIRNIMPGKVAGNADSSIKKNPEEPIRNELLDGLFDIDDDSNDENE